LSALQTSPQANQRLARLALGCLAVHVVLLDLMVIIGVAYFFARRW
jgi:hypothetical protein